MSEIRQQDLDYVPLSRRRHGYIAFSRTETLRLLLLMKGNQVSQDLDDWSATRICNVNQDLSENAELPVANYVLYLC